MLLQGRSVLTFSSGLRNLNSILLHCLPHHQQNGIIPARLDDLPELAEGLCTSLGIEVYGTLRFFIGDHPVQQFERGIQLGSTYKCGSCGCPDVRMDDFAFSCCCEWQSLANLQAVVLAGKHGKNAGVLNAFHNLKVAELQEELHARVIWDADKLKKEL